MNRKCLLWPLEALLLTACEKGLVEDMEGVGNGQAANSVLQVRTRAGGANADAATVSYPVTVYVFQGSECRAVQTIGDEGQTLSIPLTEGTYTVCAVGGVSAEDYVLPTTDDAITTTAITLRDGHAHGDLMAASATATLTDGGTNTVTLGMERKTMLLQDVTIRRVPTEATAVSVTVAPLWQSLCIGGTYSGTNGSATIAFERQSDGRTWQNTTETYLLPPSSQPASVSVNITIGGSTKTYTYSTSNELEAGYKINIEGTYTEAVGVSLTGTITGATWKSERTIRFDFDESGSSGTPAGDDGGTTTGAESLPAAGTLFRGCYVLTSDGTTATLLSPAETAIGKPRSLFSGNDEVTQTIGTIIDGMAIDGIGGWRLPTLAEINRAYSCMDAINTLFADGATPLTSTRKYFYTDGEGQVLVRTLSLPDMAGMESFPNNAYVRPVAVITKQ